VPAAQEIEATIKARTEYKSALTPSTNTGALSKASPTTPLRRAITNKREGRFRSRKLSISATQMGVVPTTNAAKLESACCSAQTTMPLPPPHNNVPDPARMRYSLVLNRIFCLETHAHRMSNSPAATIRMKPIVKGGKPDPSLTTTRIAKYVLPQTTYTTDKCTKPFGVIVFVSAPDELGNSFEAVKALLFKLRFYIGSTIHLPQDLQSIEGEPWS
jgi:hypothetical protein